MSSQQATPPSSLASGPVIYDPAIYPTTPGDKPAPPAPPLSQAEVDQLTQEIAEAFFTDSSPKK